MDDFNRSRKRFNHEHSEPRLYTILFKSAGTLEGQADCNSFSGTYMHDNGNFYITLGASTQAYCGEESLDTRYLGLLSSVVAGGPVTAGVFSLSTDGGAQIMEFRR